MLFALSVFVLTGCATRVTFQAQRPPNLDTLGLHRITVAPFATNIWGTESLARELRSQATSNIQATGAFTLVSYDTVRNVQVRGGSIEPYVDAVFRGRLTGFTSSTREEPWERRNRQGEIIQRGVNHIRVTEVAFEYYLVLARDGSMVGPVRRDGRLRSQADSSAGLPSAISHAYTIIRQQMAVLRMDLAPHTIALTRTMEREPNRDLRPLMNAADARRRAGDYLGARQAFIAIWENHRSIPAAINAAILYEATGSLEEGIFFMAEVFEATRAPRVSQKLAQLNREAEYVLGFAAFDDQAFPAERLANHAVSEVKRVVPPATSLWVHNTAPGVSIVQDVIDNMLSSFLNSDFTVVERGMIDVILAEQNLHLDGVVADSDFISIGNLAGARTVVVIGVTGTGAARRLNARVLDIETATLSMQSGTGVAWRL